MQRTQYSAQTSGVHPLPRLDHHSVFFIRFYPRAHGEGIPILFLSSPPQRLSGRFPSRQPRLQLHSLPLTARQKLYRPHIDFYLAQAQQLATHACQPLSSHLVLYQHNRAARCPAHSQPSLSLFIHSSRRNHLAPSATTTP